MLRYVLHEPVWAELRHKFNTRTVKYLAHVFFFFFFHSVMLFLNCLPYGVKVRYIFIHHTVVF